MSLTYPQYQDVFALSQALPGPASTKMLFIMVYLHAGLTPAIMAFFLWRSEYILQDRHARTLNYFSLPGASVMLLLSVGVSQIDNYLPSPVYALLSGLNAAAVGIIALAAIGVRYSIVLALSC
jgi:chromate transport protein ChrA